MGLTFGINMRILTLAVSNIIVLTFGSTSVSLGTPP
jgi:hypothetical protein